MPDGGLVPFFFSFWFPVFCLAMFCFFLCLGFFSVLVSLFYLFLSTPVVAFTLGWMHVYTPPRRCRVLLCLPLLLSWTDGWMDGRSDDTHNYRES